jgi:peptide deformylase
MLKSELVETMCCYNGAGLAAPQIGHGVMAFCVDLSESELAEHATENLESGVAIVLFNPEVEAVGDATSEGYEGCLSLPGVSCRVRRSDLVKVSGRTVSGDRVEFQASGWMARVFQHENDHLSGINMVDRVSGAPGSMEKLKSHMKLSCDDFLAFFIAHRRRIGWKLKGDSAGLRFEPEARLYVTVELEDGPRTFPVSFEESTKKGRGKPKKPKKSRKRGR